MPDDRCSSCKAPIKWAINHKTQKRAPVSLESGARASTLTVKERTGRVVLFRREGERDTRAHYVTKAEAEALDAPTLDTEVPTETVVAYGIGAVIGLGETLYLNHFADCPTAHRH